MDKQKDKQKQNSLPKAPDDQFTIRCPRLGHQINYQYCRFENKGLPCFKTLDCWFSHFDVQASLQKQLSEAEFEKVFSCKTPPKILSLLDLIEQAKQSKEGAD